MRVKKGVFKILIRNKMRRSTNLEGLFSIFCNHDFVRDL